MADRIVVFLNSSGARQNVKQDEAVLVGGMKRSASQVLLDGSIVTLAGSGVTISAPVDMASHKITSMADPASAQDAATKSYVDSTVGSSPLYIKKDGSVAFTGDESMGSHKLTNVTDPASAQDAATKNYVDTLFIHKDGSVAFTADQSMGTHKLTGVAAPASGGDATNKTYVDTQEALDVRLDGSRPMTGALNLGAHLIHNVVDPAAAQDAATKNYVDSAISSSGVTVLTTVNQASGSFSTSSGAPSTLPNSAFSFTVGATTLVAIDVFVYYEQGATNFDNGVQFFVALKDTDSLVVTEMWSSYQGVQANGTPSANGQTGYTGIKRYIASFAAGTHNYDLQGRVSGGGSFSLTYPLSIVVSAIG